MTGILFEHDWMRDLNLNPEQTSLGSSLLFLLWVPGALIGGQLSDTYGRKPVAVGFTVMIALSLIGTALLNGDASTSPEVVLSFFAARAAGGVACGGTMGPAYALLIESTDKREAGRASFGWSTGQVLGVLIRAAIHCSITGIDGGGDVSSWRAEEVALGALSLASALATSAFVAESPPFLAASGDVAGSMRAVRTMVCWNSVALHLPVETPETPERRGSSSLAPLHLWTEATSNTSPKADSSSNGSSGSWADLISPGGELLPLTASLRLLQFSWNLAYYALVFSAARLSDAVLLNLLCLAAADLPGGALANHGCSRHGARNTAASLLAASGAALLVLAGLAAAGPNGDGGGGSCGGEVEPRHLHALASTGVSLVGKSVANGAFASIFLLTSERYLTKLATVGLGCGTAFGKIGASAAPPLVALLPLPTAVGMIGMASLIASAVALSQALPEMADEKQRL